MTLVNIGISPAGRRIHEAGLAYQRREKLALIPAAVSAPEPEQPKGRKWPFAGPLVEEEEGSGLPVLTSVRILREVAAAHSLSVIEMCSQGRNRKLVMARQEFVYRMMTETHYSTPQIGRIIGGRDHTTVLRCVRVYCQRTGTKLPRGIESGGEPIQGRYWPKVPA